MSIKASEKELKEKNTKNIIIKYIKTILDNDVID
jgi:hypothetical protein